MCTLSWKPVEKGYVLFFNRDESRRRAAARAPSLQKNKGVSYLAPTDPVGGGTWLLVNEYGLSIGLLNNYAVTSATAITGASSRGLLPLNCADCASVAEAIGRITSMSLNAYPPFHLVVMAMDEATMLTWDGIDCTVAALKASGEMLTTSAFKSELVANVRDDTFNRLVGDISVAQPAQLKAFHWYADHEGATSVRMSRPDACTHNISEITVSMDREVAHFKYSPQAGIHGDKRIPPPTSLLLPLTKSFSMRNQ